MKINIKNIDLDDIDGFPIQEKIRRKPKLIKKKNVDDKKDDNDNYVQETLDNVLL